MISDPTKRALDIVWQAQDELWKPRPDFHRARDLGHAALRALQHPRHASNACLVLAKAHEGLQDWCLAVVYWEKCRDLYGAGWNGDMAARLAMCREFRDAADRAWARARARP